MSDSLWPHGLQHARPPCPSSTLRACSNSCPSSQWCHPTISSSVIPFSCLQSSPASESFQMSQFFASSGQSIGASASSEYSRLTSFRMDWFDLLAGQGTEENGMIHLNRWKGNSTMNSLPGKAISHIWRKDKQKLEEFSTNKPVLLKNDKGVYQSRK